MYIIIKRNTKLQTRHIVTTLHTALPPPPRLGQPRNPRPAHRDRLVSRVSALSLSPRLARRRLWPVEVARPVCGKLHINKIVIKRYRRVSVLPRILYTDRGAKQIWAAVMAASTRASIYSPAAHPTATRATAEHVARWSRRRQFHTSGLPSASSGRASRTSGTRNNPRAAARTRRTGSARSARSARRSRRGRRSRAPSSSSRPWRRARSRPGRGSARSSPSAAAPRCT